MNDAPSAARVILIGPMGCGKTTLGRRAAAELGLEFFDCDEEIEKRSGVSVNLIFDIEGESGFRERETRMLKELLQHEGVLIATGGGVVTQATNRVLLKEGGLVVWLRTSVSQQLRRLAQDRKRPLLQAPDRRGRLSKLARERDPLYQETADLSFQSGARGVKQVARELAQTIHKALLAQTVNDRTGENHESN